MNQKKKVNIQYYAILRERAQKSTEEFFTSAETAKELFLELDQKYRFNLKDVNVRVAIDQEFKEMSEKILEGQTLVFIPPVSGG